MKRKYFVVSDIHGYFTEFIRDLKEAGFDENNKSHVLITLGDNFDRGQESLAVYEYLKKLNDKGKAICVRGNHDGMFIDYLEHSTSPFNYLHNGTNTTFDGFLHRTRALEMYCFGLGVPCTIGIFANFIEDARNEIKGEYPELLDWLKSLPYYYETKNYIFTHASIDTKAKDWHNPNCYRHIYKGWEALTWDDGSFITQKNNTGKTIVVGHFDTGSLRDMYQIDSKDRDDHSILKTKDNKIFIDGCVPLTKKVNVLVIEDEQMGVYNDG